MGPAHSEQKYHTSGLLLIGIMYNILSLTYSSLSTADLIPLCVKLPVSK
jgi:hypothetical protein